MNIQSPVQIGLSGISRGLEALQDTARDIAQTGTNPDSQNATLELTQSLVDLQEQKNATLASIKVVAAADEVLGSLLDITV